MNTIGEILKEKRKKNETIYETYERVLCPDCSNRYNTKEVCDISVTEDRETKEKTAKCINFKRCMENQCKTCRYINRCFEEE